MVFLHLIDTPASDQIFRVINTMSRMRENEIESTDENIEMYGTHECGGMNRTKCKTFVLL